MCRSMACFALQAAMTFRESVQRQSLSRCISISGEGLADGYPFRACDTIEYRRITDLAIILSGGTGMATLTAGFIQPTGALRAADFAHITVAALALHFQTTIGRNRTAHCAA